MRRGVTRLSLNRSIYISGALAATQLFRCIDAGASRLAPSRLIIINESTCASLGFIPRRTRAHTHARAQSTKHKVAKEFPRDEITRGIVVKLLVERLSS